MTMPASRTIPGLLDEMAARLPDRELLIYGDERLTYRDVRDRARRLAKGLFRIGVRKGDTVALLMGNRTEWLLADFAVQVLGATLLAVNTWWRRRELEYALNHGEASVLIMADHYLKQDYVAMLEDMGDLTRTLPKLRRIVCLGERHTPGALPFEDLWALGEDVADAEIDGAQDAVAPDDVAYLLYTSGSTAWPKAVPLAHRGLIENPHGIGARMHLGERDRVLLGVSLFWIFACGNALFAALAHGASIVLQSRFDAGEALGLIERERCTAVYALPNMALALHGHPERPRRDLSSLRTGLTMNPTVPHMLELGASEICVCYGLTECYGNSTVTDAHEPVELRRRSCGPALPGTEIVVADPVTHAPLPAGEVGEVKIRGYVTTGYFKDTEATAKAFDRDGFFLSGDLGLLDAEGRLHFRGRMKELVKSGGINIAPAEVEEVLLSHPAVNQAVVVGVPDPVKEEVLAAAVVLKRGASASAGTLQDHCRAQAAAYKVPTHVAFLSDGEMPLTDTGKVSKRGLQDWFAAYLERDMKDAG